MTKGVFVGRFCPIHLGHEAVIGKMIERCGVENCLIVIGSSNAPLSLRHFFSYEFRRKFIAELFPGLKVVGLPDYPTDKEWLAALDDVLCLWCDPTEVTFFGGCEEEVVFFFDSGRRVEIINRFDGTTPKISATEVRDALIRERSLDGLLRLEIQSSVKDAFQGIWERFKRM